MLRRGVSRLRSASRRFTRPTILAAAIDLAGVAALRSFARWFTRRSTGPNEWGGPTLWVMATGQLFKTAFVVSFLMHAVRHYLAG